MSVDHGSTISRPFGALPDPRAWALAAWQRLREQEDLAAASPTTREERLDAERRRHALCREEATLHEHLSRTGPQHADRPTAVVVHRLSWLRAKMEQVLAERGIAVVGHAEDGADGSGVCIALTPTLLLLEAQLPSLSGLEVARRVRRCSPDTIVTAQVPHHEAGVALLAAGAVRVWSRSVPPVVIAAELAELLRSGQERLSAAPA